MAKGLFFTLDTIFAIIIAISMVVAINFFLTRSQSDPAADLYIEKVANDILLTMVKNRTFENPSNASIAAAFNDILPENLGGVLDVKLYRCGNPSCTSFVSAGSYKVNKCRTNILDVMLVIDRSGSMAGQQMTDAKNAAKIFVDELDAFNDRSGLVSFDGWSFLWWGDPDAELDVNLTFDKASVKSGIDSLNANGGTAMGTGIQYANDHLRDMGRSGAVWAEVVLTDGRSNRGIDPLAAANNAKARGIVVYTIGLGSDTDGALLQQIADLTGGKYFYAPDSSQLNNIYLEIAEDLLKREFEVSLAKTSFVTFQGQGVSNFGTAELRMCVI